MMPLLRPASSCAFATPTLIFVLLMPLFSLRHFADAAIRAIRQARCCHVIDAMPYAADACRCRHFDAAPMPLRLR